MTRKRKTAQQPKADAKPVFFEHVEQKSEYDRIAERILSATGELNSALQEAHELAEMRVFLAARPCADGKASRFEPQIYRLSHSTLTYEIRKAPMQWQVVKDPAFQPVAGQAFDARIGTNSDARPKLP